MEVYASVYQRLEELITIKPEEDALPKTIAKSLLVPGSMVYTALLRSQDNSLPPGKSEMPGAIMVDVGKIIVLEAMVIEISKYLL